MNFATDASLSPTALRHQRRSLENLAAPVSSAGAEGARRKQTSVDTERSQRMSQTPVGGSAKKRLMVSVLAAAGARAQAESLSDKRAVIDQFAIAGGTATAADMTLLAAELGKLPLTLLKRVADDSTFKMIAVKNNITDWPDLTSLVDINSTPRGYPANATQRDVDGVFFGANNIAVVAITTTGGLRIDRANYLGRASTALHELGHYINRAWGPPSVSYYELSYLSEQPDFINARTKDYAYLTSYYRQAGAAGRSETFAEYFGQSFNIHSDYDSEKNLFAYFDNFLCGYGYDSLQSNETQPTRTASCAATITSPYVTTTLVPSTSKPIVTQRPPRVSTKLRITTTTSGSSSSSSSISTSGAQRTTRPAAVWGLIDAVAQAMWRP